MNFEELKASINVAEFNAEILDGKMVITPSDSGVALLAMLQMQQNLLNGADTELDENGIMIEKLQDEVALLRDLVEEVIEVLIKHKEEDIVDKINNTLYPLVGTYDDGTEVVINYIEDRKLDNNK